MNQNIFLQKGIGQQSKILKKIKQASNLTWKEITEILKVNKSMLFKYLSEDHSMPLKRLEKLCKATKTDLKKLGSLKLIKLKKVEEKRILKPELDEKSSEFLGALTGDGNIYSKNHEISITCGAVAD